MGVERSKKESRKYTPEKLRSLDFSAVTGRGVSQRIYSAAQQAKKGGDQTAWTKMKGVPANFRKIQLGLPQIILENAQKRNGVG